MDTEVDTDKAICWIIALFVVLLVFGALRDREVVENTTQSQCAESD